MNQDPQEILSEDLRALATATGSEGSRALARLVDKARSRPLELVQYLPQIGGLLDSANAQVREASLQSLALISEAAPSAVAFLLPRLHSLLAKDSTETVWEQAVAIVSNYGRSSRSAAERALPILREAGERVRRATAVPLIAGLTRLTEMLPDRRKEILDSVTRLQTRWGRKKD